MIYAQNLIGCPIAMNNGSEIKLGFYPEYDYLPLASYSGKGPCPYAWATTITYSSHVLCIL